MRKPSQDKTMTALMSVCAVIAAIVIAAAFVDPAGLRDVVLGAVFACFGGRS